jgi:glyoxylase-like metal-dependent hydrolase (beta-lactamase superfamily II)
LFANLRAAGIDPGTIDVVALTHPHIDHAWGLVDRNDRLNFPNARLAVTQADWDFWTQESLLASPARDFVLYTRTNMLPYRDRLLPVRDGAEMVPGITAMATPGHTAGHISYVIESEGRRLINLGDVCHHHIVLLRNPGWRVAFDSDPVQGARTRQDVLARAASSGDLLSVFHFPFPGHGHVVREGAGFAWLPAPMHAG